jgi:hypothetical protein
MSSITVDEFGRDESLRENNDVDYFYEHFKLHFQGKSWAEMSWESDEEEEEEEEKSSLHKVAEADIEIRWAIEDEEYMAILLQDAMRKSMWIKTEYEPEDGEIFE